VLLRIIAATALIPPKGASSLTAPATVCVSPFAPIRAISVAPRLTEKRLLVCRPICDIFACCRNGFATARVGTNVRFWRKRLDVSQEELAFRAGLHRTYVSGVERGVRNPTVVILGRLAKALHVEPAVLLAKEIGRR
jgi:DNA-binding XRE family transcriptional regulator